MKPLPVHCAGAKMFLSEVVASTALTTEGVYWQMSASLLVLSHVALDLYHLRQ